MSDSFEGFSSKELAILFMENDEDDTLKSIIRSFCFRYYTKLDINIRFLFRREGLPYQVNKSYYEDVYWGVCRRIFAIDIFLKKLSHFDIRKDFEPWFRRVIRNEIRDWLKVVDPETGLTNRELIKLRAKEIGIEGIGTDKDDTAKKAFEIPANKIREMYPDSADSGKHIRSLLDELPDYLRVI